MHTLPINLPLAPVINDQGGRPLDGVGGPTFHVTNAASNQSQIVILSPGEMNRVVAFRWNN